MKVLRDLLLGIGHDPRVVASFRALVLYVLPLGAELLIGYLTGHVTDPHFIPVLPLTATVIRALEGAVLDYLKNPHQNDVPAVPVGGIK